MVKKDLVAIDTGEILFRQGCFPTRLNLCSGPSRRVAPSILHAHASTIKNGLLTVSLCWRARRLPMLLYPANSSRIIRPSTFEGTVQIQESVSARLWVGPSTSGPIVECSTSDAYSSVVRRQERNPFSNLMVNLGKTKDENTPVLELMCSETAFTFKEVIESKFGFGKSTIGRWLLAPHDILRSISDAAEVLVLAAVSLQQLVFEQYANPDHSIGS